MSHVSTLSVKTTDLNLSLEAFRRMGYTVESAPEGETLGLTNYFGHEEGRSAHRIDLLEVGAYARRVRNTRHVGIRKVSAEDGDACAYEFFGDFYGVHREDFTEDFQREYAYANIETAALATGYEITSSEFDEESGEWELEVREQYA